MRSLTLALPGAALLLAACGTISSPNYNTPLEVATDARDAVVYPDNAITDTAQPVVDAALDAAPAGHGPPYPIILHHGFGGFRQLAGLTYYYNVGDDLRARGEVVYETRLPPFLPPSERAYSLRDTVDQVLRETGAAKVIIIGHSQGGLDPRYLISSLGYGDRVAMLVTIAAPHRGSYVADAILGIVPQQADSFLNAVGNLLGYTIYQIQDTEDLRAATVSLTRDYCAQFNRDNPDDPRVVYWSWAGRSEGQRGETACSGARIPNDPTQTDDINPLLAPLGAINDQGDVANHVNDGLVEVSSARWGIFMGCIPADHFDEVGQIAHTGTQPSGFNHIEFYRDVVRRIREAGF
jgi:triacylglycerol lipase